MTAKWTLGRTIIPAPHGTFAWFVPDSPVDSEIQGPYPVLAIGFPAESVTDTDDNDMYGGHELRRSERAAKAMGGLFEFMQSYAFLVGDFGEEPWFEIGREAFFTHEGAQFQREVNMRRAEKQEKAGN